MKLTVGLYTSKAHRIVEDAVKLAILELKAAVNGVPNTRIVSHLAFPFETVYSEYSKSNFADWLDHGLAGTGESEFKAVSPIALAESVTVGSQNEACIELDQVADKLSVDFMRELAKVVRRLAAKDPMRGYKAEEAQIVADVLDFGVDEAYEINGKREVEAVAGKPLDALAAAAVSTVDNEIKKTKQEWAEATEKLTAEFDAARAAVIAEYNGKFDEMEAFYQAKIAELKKKADKLRKR